MPAEVDAVSVPAAEPHTDESNADASAGFVLSVTPADNNASASSDDEKKQQQQQQADTKHPLPAFAEPSRPAPPAASPYARPESFPSESWPTPPLVTLQAPGGTEVIAKQLDALPGGSAERFARWVVGTATVVEYEGERLPGGGLPHGQGRATFKNGQTYEGSWHEGLMHGEGVLTWTDEAGQETVYAGQMTHQAVTGFGRLLWHDGSTYQGEVLDGLRHGQGVFIDPTVPTGPVMYEGSWVHGLRDGSGKLTYDDEGSHFYEGQFRAGARHGYGLLRYASGNLYEGEWMWDRKVGQGTMSWFTRNQKYVGSWLNDKPHGQGQYTWLELPVPGLQGQGQQMTVLSPRSVSARAASAAAAAAQAAAAASAPSAAAAVQLNTAPAAPILTHFQHHNTYIGSWVQGVREGEGSFFYSNGSLYSGEWKADRKEGQGRFTFANGSSYEGAFEGDLVKDAAKWSNPYTGVAEAAAAQAAARAAAGVASSAASVPSRRKGADASTTSKDIGMFDLPLQDLLVSYTRDVGIPRSERAAYMSEQRDAVANALLRFNSELLDIYRFYAHASVEVAQPDYVAPVLPYTPLSPTNAPPSATHVSAQASAVSARMNLAQLWLLLSDLGLLTHPALEHVDLSLATLDRTIFRRQLLNDPDAHAQRQLVSPGASESIHDPRNVLLLRDFLEALVRISDEVMKPLPTDDEEEDGDKKDDEDDEEEEQILPGVLYSRALSNFNNILSGVPSASSLPAPAASSTTELSLPLHALASLSLSSPSNRTAAAGAAGSTLPSPTAAASLATAASRSYGTPLSSTLTGARSASASAQAQTLSNRFKRFLLEFVLPRARTRSKNAFGQQVGLAPLGPQPLYKLPALAMLVKRYEREIYQSIFKPHSVHQPALLISAAPVAPGSLISRLPPLQDRTLSLQRLLSLLQRPGSGVLTPYFTLYHVFDILFGPGRPRNTSLHAGLGAELLFEEVCDTLVRIALYRGKVLGEVAESIARERAALERVRQEKRERAEEQARRSAALEAAAAEAAAAAAATAVSDSDAKGSKSSAKGSGAGAAKISATSSAAPSKPSSASAGKKPSSSSAVTSPAAPKGKLAAPAKGAVGKSPAPTPRSGSGKKDSNSAKGKAAAKTAAAGSSAATPTAAAASKSGSTPTASKPSSAKRIRPSSGAGANAAAALASGSATPHASAPNSSRLTGGGESGTLRKQRRDSAQSNADPIPELATLSLADGGAQGAWALAEHDVQRMCADTELFLCALLGKEAPQGLAPSFPAELSEEPADASLPGSTLPL